MLNMRWFYALNKDENSLMNKSILENENLIVAEEYEERKFRFCVFRTCLEFYNYAKNDIGFENNCFFEVIRGTKSQKPYFDIDIGLKEDSMSSFSRQQKIKISEKIVPLIVKTIFSKYPMIKKEDIFVFNSHGEHKRSFHIVIDRWCFPTCKQNKQFCEKIMEGIPSIWHCFIDSGLYKSSQQFRMPLSHKNGTSRVKMIDKTLCSWEKDEDIIFISEEQEHMYMFISSLIGNTDSCNVLPFEIPEQEELVFSKEISECDFEEIKEIISNMENSNCFSIRKVEGTMIAMKRHRPCYCESCERTHEHENPFVFVTFANNVYFNCNRGGNSIIIGKLGEKIKNNDISFKEKEIKKDDDVSFEQFVNEKERENFCVSKKTAEKINKKNEEKNRPSSIFFNMEFS